MILKHFTLSLIAIVLVACTNSANSSDLDKTPYSPPKKANYNSVAYFASGCFWCVEAVFESVIGVAEVESGYSGGTEKNPSYELICTGRTRHAEAVKVYYDNKKISYEQLLVVFFDSHNPETLNQQGPDKGPQYRSMIFYQNELEKTAIQKYIKQLRANQTFKNITTEVVPLDVFYMAEDYHQDYERNHPNNSYVRAVSIPRIEAFKKKHPELLKK
ncbi:MAG: peptide-methionine (S)-S-oxide reductase MsrA [Bacteroidetes bacterium]|nr:peptide-methionine (S)-S-oxide reductase MsrA [Bacteroidota bacterium]